MGEAMIPDKPVTRAEFDAVKDDHERRLTGHDSLYKEIQEARRELVLFRAELAQARRELDMSLTDRDRCKDECNEHRDNLNKRLVVLERFRWQISTAITIIAVIPTWVMLYLNITGGC